MLVAHQNISSLFSVVDLWHWVNRQGSKALNFDLWNQQSNAYWNRNLSFLFCFLSRELSLCMSFMWIKWKLTNHLCYYKGLLGKCCNRPLFVQQRWATKCWFLRFFMLFVRFWTYGSWAFCFWIKWLLKRVGRFWKCISHWFSKFILFWQCHCLSITKLWDCYFCTVKKEVSFCPKVLYYGYVKVYITF